MKKALPSSTKVVVIGGGVAGCSGRLSFSKIWLERHNTS
jgi:succinate dehydrogenase/fumarate reductase flavoprotein subunit